MVVLSHSTDLVSFRIVPPLTSGLMALASFFADKYPHIRPLAMSASVTHGQTQRKPAVDGAVACRRLSRGVGARRCEDGMAAASRRIQAGLALSVPSRERQQSQVWASGDMVGSIGCRRCSMPSAARTSTNQLVGGRSQRMGAPSIDYDMGVPGTARPGGTTKHAQAHPSTSKPGGSTSSRRAQSPEQPGREPSTWTTARRAPAAPETITVPAGCTCAIRARGPASLQPETPD